MPVFGETTRFAVEIYPLDAADCPRDHSDIVYGHCSFRIDGQSVGNGAYLQRLRFFQVACEALVEHQGFRDAPELSDLRSDELFAFFDRMLYGRNEGTTYDESRQRARVYTRFDIRPRGVEAFDSWKMFLLENGKVARLVWRHLDAPVHEVTLESGAVDACLSQVIAWFHDVYPMTTR